MTSPKNIYVGGQCVLCASRFSNYLEYSVVSSRAKQNDIELDNEFSVHKITMPQLTHPHLPSYSLVQGEKCQVWQQGANAVLRSAHTMGLVPATSRRDQLHHMNWPFLPQNLRQLQGPKLQVVPRIQTGLNLWDQSQGLKLVSATRF